MLTAEEARAIKPLATDDALILSRIEDAIRRRMQSGLDYMIDVTAMIPHPHHGAVIRGDTSDVLDTVVATLEAGGYTVTRRAGDRPCFRVAW